MSRLICSLVALLVLAGCGGGSKAPEAANGAASPPAESAGPGASAKVTPAVASGQERSENQIQQTSATVPVTRQLTYEQALDLADELIKKREMNAAAKVLTGAINARPGAPQAYAKRAAILADARLLTRAVSDMSAAIELDPNNPKFYNTRGYFLLLKQEYDAAELDFNNAIAKANFKYQHPYNNRGLVFIARKDFSNAVKEFELALKIDPKYVDAQNNLGFALLQLDRTDDAIAAFTKAIELDEAYVNAVNNRGRAYHKAGRYEEAVADFTRALEIQPNNLQYYMHRAESYKAWGREADAQADLAHVTWVQKQEEFNKLLAASPRNADLWVGYGRHLAAKQRADEALKCYEQALKLVPEHAQAYLSRGMLRMQQNNPQEAIKDLTRAILTEPLLEAYSLRGDAHLKLGHLDQAIADYETAKRIDSQVVQAYMQRSEEHKGNGEVQLAAADQQRAEQLQQLINARESAGSSEGPAPRPFTAEVRAGAKDTDASLQ